jgi:hypothetical protein
MPVHRTHLAAAASPPLLPSLSTSIAQEGPRRRRSSWGERHRLVLKSMGRVGTRTLCRLPSQIRHGRIPPWEIDWGVSCMDLLLKN